MLRLSYLKAIVKKHLLLFVLPIFYSTVIFSQSTDEKENIPAVSKSYFKSSLSYLSNAVYQGRKDSAVISYITPSISYINKHGWNITGALSYSPNAGINEIELITFETGYDHKFSSSFGANAYAAAYFYNQFSTSVQAAKNVGIGVGIDYSPKDIFNLSADAGFSVAKKPDISTTVSIGHPFYMGSAGHDFSIAPTAALIAGTQSYYQNYYTDKKFNQLIRARQGRGRGRTNSGTTTTTSSKKINVTSGKSYNVLDYDLSIPVTYDEKKWGLFLIPVYSMPVHPLVYYEEGSLIPITETLTNSFYFTLGAYIKF